jgi:hypothetical protein
VSCDQKSSLCSMSGPSGPIIPFRARLSWQEARTWGSTAKLSITMMPYGTANRNRLQTQGA